MKLKMRTVLASAAVLTAGSVMAADIELPKPETSGGMPLMEALAKRRTERRFSPEPLSAGELSNLLWAAAGVNRPDGRLTAPTALNRQEIVLYVQLADGVFRYDAAANKLIRISTEKAEIPGGAPVAIIMVADFNRQPARQYALVDCGFIGQNVYLFAASNGLATVFRGSFDKESLTRVLKLDQKHEVLFVQVVGRPAK